MLDAVTPLPIYLAKARTGSRRRARPERFCSYGHAHKVSDQHSEEKDGIPNTWPRAQGVPPQSYTPEYRRTFPYTTRPVTKAQTTKVISDFQCVGGRF